VLVGEDQRKFIELADKVGFGAKECFENSFHLHISGNKKIYFRKSKTIAFLLRIHKIFPLKIFRLLTGASAPSAVLIPELVGMDGQRMSSTQPDFHLDPLDRTKQLRQKVAKSFCEPGNLNGNVALRLAEAVLFPLVRLSAGEGGGKVNFFRANNKPTMKFDILHVQTQPDFVPQMSNNIT